MMCAIPVELTPSFQTRYFFIWIVKFTTAAAARCALQGTRRGFDGVGVAKGRRSREAVGTARTPHTRTMQS